MTIVLQHCSHAVITVGNTHTHTHAQNNSNALR